jgi:hypothetical protein
MRLEVPAISNDDMIRLELVDSRPKAAANLGCVPHSLIKLDRLPGNRTSRVPLTNAPRRVPSVEVLNLVTGPSEKLHQFDGVNDTTTCRWPVKQETHDRDFVSARFLFRT